MIAHAHRQISQIGRDPNLDALRAKRISHRIGRIMRNGERLHLNVSHLKSMPSLKRLVLLQLRTLAFFITHGPRPCLVRPARHEHWDAQLLGQRCQSVNVIGMLVRDENCGESTWIFAQRLEPLERFTARNPGIHQNLRAGAGHHRAIPAAPRSQHSHTYTHDRSIRAQPVDRE